MLEQCDASDVPEAVEFLAEENNVEIVLGAWEACLYFRGAAHRDVSELIHRVLYLSPIGKILCQRWYDPCPCCDFKTMGDDVIKAEWSFETYEWAFQTKIDHCKYCSD